MRDLQWCLDDPDRIPHYAADASLIAPLILVGRQHWTDTYPAWPLLQRLGDGRMGELIYCVDDVYEATSLLTAQSRPH